MKEDCGTVLALRPGEHRGGQMSRRKFSAEPAYLVIPSDYLAARLTQTNGKMNPAGVGMAVHTYPNLASLQE